MSIEQAAGPSVLEKEVYPEKRRSIGQDSDSLIIAYHIEEMRQFPLDVPRNRVLGR